LVAGGAKTSPTARKRHEQLLAALGATDGGEPVLEVAALEELARDRPDNRPPEAVPLLIALLIDGFKLRVEALDQLIKWRLLRAAGTIDAAGLLGPAEHTRPPCGGRLRPSMDPSKRSELQGGG
jgi:hypothetical protein